MGASAGALAAAFLRLYHVGLGTTAIHPDEAMNGSNTLQVIETGIRNLLSGEQRPRGLFIICSTFVVTLATPEFALPVAVAIFGILTVAGVYALARS